MRQISRVRSVTRRYLGLAVGLVALSYASASSAARSGDDGVTIDLGGGMAATPNHSPCGGAICVTWTARGFWTPVTSLPSANMYANAGNGRVVAAFRRAFAYSDDRGRTWQFSALERGAIPMALAFDLASGFGTAVGSAGSMWTSEDRGATWTLRRSGGTDNLIEVVVRNRTFAFVSARGDVSVSVRLGRRRHERT